MLLVSTLSVGTWRISVGLGLKKKLKMTQTEPAHANGWILNLSLVSLLKGIKFGS